MDDRTGPRRSLDDAIDRAVRHVMNADPRPGFDGRVMRRLERPARRPFAWPHLATAAGALAAIVVLAVVLSDRRSAPQRAPERSAAPQSGPAVATGVPVPQRQLPSVPTAAPAAPSGPQRVRTRPQERRPPVGGEITAASVEAAPLDEPPIAMIGALAPPSALAVEDIEPRAVNVAPITMEPIEIDRLSVQPLPPPDGRAKE